MTDIRRTEDSLDLQTNAGIMSTNMKLNIPEWCEACYNPNAITNIFSYAEMAKNHRITTDSANDNAFILLLPYKMVRYEPTSYGLYVYIPKGEISSNLQLLHKSGKKPKLKLLNTVEENQDLYSPSHVERAKRLVIYIMHWSLHQQVTFKLCYK